MRNCPWLLDSAPALSLPDLFERFFLRTKENGAATPAYRDPHFGPFEYAGFRIGKQEKTAVGIGCKRFYAFIKLI